MNRTGLLAFPANSGASEYLEDLSVRQLVIDLYDREHLALQRYLIFIGLTIEEAQDCVHDSFVKLHEHLTAGGEQSNLRAWLYRVCHNLARNAQSSYRNTKTDAMLDAAPAGELVAEELSAEQTLLAKEQRQQLRLALAALSPAQRECLLLRTQGLKYREIAEVMKLSVSTVGENITRGIEKLKDLL